MKSLSRFTSLASLDRLGCLAVTRDGNLPEKWRLFKRAVAVTSQESVDIAAKGARKVFFHAPCTCTKKGSRRYGYYVCVRHQKHGAAACPGSRVAVGELEAFVVDRIKEIGRDPRLVRETINAARKELLERRPRLDCELKDHEKTDCSHRFAPFFTSMPNDDSGKNGL